MTKKFLSVLLAALTIFSAVAVFTPVQKASAAYYNTYTDVALTPNASSCGSMQGMAIGKTYIYAIKRDDSDTNCIIYKVARESGNKVLLTNSATGGSTVSGMGHANDACLTVIDGVETMFVTTMVSGSNNLYRIKLSGDYFTVEKKYTIKVNGSAKGMSGIDIISVADGKINFLFKSGGSIYQGSLATNAATGTTITATYDFAINVSSVVIDGTTTDLSSWTYQGVGYYNDMMFVPVTNGAKSVIIVYAGVSLASGTVKSKADLSFRITSSTYSALFEMESCGIGPDGKLYFNTNRRKSSSDTNHDGVHYFNNFNMSSLSLTAPTITAASEIELDQTVSVSWSAPTHVIKYNYSAVLNNGSTQTTLKSANGVTSTSFTVPAVSEGQSITVSVTAIGPYDNKTSTKTINIKNAVPTDITSLGGNIEKDVVDGTGFTGFGAGTTVSAALDMFAEDTAFLQIRDTNGATVSDTGIVCTGFTVNIVSNGTVYKSYSLIVDGDCTGDGMVNSADYVSLSKHLNNSSVLDGVYRKAVDCNKSGDINTADYIVLKGVLANN